MTTAISTEAQTRIDAQKKDADRQLATDMAIAVAGFSVLVAAAFFPPIGIVGAVGAVIGISNSIDAVRSGTRLAGLHRSERELAEGKLEDTKTRADKFGKVAKTGRRIALGTVAVALAGLVTAALAPAVLPMAAAAAFLSTVAWPVLGVMAVSRAVEGAAQGAQGVVMAAEPPAPAAPAAAAQDATPKPSRFASLKKLFTRSAAPANDDTKPAAPEAKPAAAPQAPKP